MCVLFHIPVIFIYFLNLHCHYKSVMTLMWILTIKIFVDKNLSQPENIVMCNQPNETMEWPTQGNSIMYIYCLSLFLITYYTFCNCVYTSYFEFFKEFVHILNRQNNDKISISCLFHSFELSNAKFILIAVCTCFHLAQYVNIANPYAHSLILLNTVTLFKLLFNYLTYWCSTKKLLALMLLCIQKQVALLTL